MTLTQTLKGRASAWLLSRPSNQQINRASLATAFGVLVLMVLFFATIGILQWTLSEQIQKKQTSRAATFLDKATTALEMSLQLGDSHRSTLAYLLAREPGESQDSLDRRQNALAGYEKNLALIEAHSDPNLISQKNQTTRLAAEYESASSHLIEIVQSGQMDQALDYRLQTLRPLFESWQYTHENFATALAAKASAKDSTTENFIRNLQIVLLALIFIPILLLALAAISLATLLGWEKFASRTQSTPDPWSH